MILDLANPGHHSAALGETWEGLADRWYGEAHLWPIIAANHIADWTRIKVGQTIYFPSLN